MEPPQPRVPGRRPGDRSWDPDIPVRSFLSLGPIVVLAACAAAEPTPSLDPSASGTAFASPSTEPSFSERPTASAAGSPGATPGSSAPLIPTPSATPPAELLRSATVEREGIRVRVELQRNPLVAGEPSWVRTTVRNLGTGDVTWYHDGCAESVIVSASSGMAWPPGRDQAGRAGEFKYLALGITGFGEEPGPARLDFVPRRLLGKGSYGCADIGIGERIRPGGAIRQTLWWTGYADVNRGLPPTGPATISAVAEYYWRGHREPRRILDQKLSLRLDAWIVGGLPSDRLAPAEIADAALADPAFAAFIATQELRSGREEILWYDPDADVWEVGIMPWYETDPPRIRGVIVDSVSGAILGTLDRPWTRIGTASRNRDGVP